QRHVAVALLHLRDWLPFLGLGLCRGPDHGAARGAGSRCAGAVLVSGPQGALPVSHVHLPPGRPKEGALPLGGKARSAKGAHPDATGIARALETAGAWTLGLLWILPLAYAVWTAFHAAEYSTHFVPTAPLTLENFH